jgi:hypothetical protein
MENRQQRTVAAFERVLDYIERYPVTPEPPLLSGMKQQLRASIDRIQKLGITQYSALMLGGGKVAHRRMRLRRGHLIPLVRTVKPHFDFAPGAEKVLRVPHARADALTVAQSALAMAKLLKPHRKLMASAGYSATYLSELQHEARELALAAKKTAAARQTRAKATNDIALEIRKGMKALTSIEGMVMRQIGGNRNAVAFWKQRRRVGARIGRPPRRKNGDAMATDPTASAEVVLSS